MAGVSHAQGCYRTIKQEGRDLLDQQRFLEALEKFELAYDCNDCPDTNDLRKWQEKCRKGIEWLIADLKSNKDKEISDLLMNIGREELDKGNFLEAVDFFSKTYDLSSTLNDSVRVISSNLVKSWYPSLTLSLREIELQASPGSADLIYDSVYGEYYYPEAAVQPVYLNRGMPLLIPPYEIVSLSGSGELVTDSLSPGIFGSNIVYNREENQIIEVSDPYTMTIWTDIADETVMKKISFKNEIKQISPGAKGNYIAISFHSDPEINIYSIADHSILNTFKPKKENLKSRKKTRKAQKEYNQVYGDIYQYNQEEYHGERNAYSDYSITYSDENPPFLILQNRLFYLHPDNITVESLNIHSGKRKHLSLNDFEVHTMASSPDEEFLVLYGEKEMLLYNVSMNLSIPVPSTGIKTGLCRFAPDGKSFAVATTNNIIELYQIENGYIYLVNSHAFPGDIFDFNFNPEGDKLVTLFNENQGDQVMQVHSLPEWHNISGNISAFYYDALIHAGITGDFVYGLSEYTLHVWALPLVYVDGKVRENEHSIELNLPGMNYLPAETNVRALKSLENVIRKARAEGLSVYRAGLSPGFEYVAISTLGPDFCIYNARTSGLHRKYPAQAMIRDFCFNGKNKIAAISEDDRIFIYDLNKEQAEKVFRPEGKTIRDFQPSSTGQFLSVMLNDGDVIIYSLESLQEYFRTGMIVNPDSSVFTPVKGWFSPGDKKFAMVSTDGMVMVFNLEEKKWEDHSDQNLYSYTGTISWENDSTYLAGSQYYGVIDRVHLSNNNESSLSIYSENVPSRIISLPESNVIVTASANGTLNLNENMKGLGLGLPFIFNNTPEVLSYDTASGDFMVYVKGDGFYRIQPFFSRSAEKIQLQLIDTSMRAGFPTTGLLGKWSFIFTDPYGLLNEYHIILEAFRDSIYYGTYQWYYYGSEDSTDMQIVMEPIECTFDPYTRLLHIKYTGEYSGMGRYDCRTYVSDDGRSLHFGTIESLDSPGTIIVNWSGKKLEEPVQGRSQQPAIRKESP
jgi:hypothetical protein